MGAADHRIDIDGVSVSPHHFIGGKRIASASSFEVRSPLDWDLKLADVSSGDAQTAQLAVSAAVDGFAIWSRMSPQERAKIMHNLADLIDKNAKDIARIECLDMAMPQESLELRLIPRGALNFRNYADLVSEHQERSWSSKGTANRVIRDPAGPESQCIDAIYHGFSDKRNFDAAEMTIRQADALADLIQALGYSWAHVEGESMGGEIVWTFGVRHPEMCGKLIMNTGGPWYTPKRTDFVENPGGGGTLASKPV